MLTAAQQGRCTLAQVVQWMCEAPARLYRIPNKGRLQVGYDADLVLVDRHTPKPVRREELLTKCGWSPFEGWELVGWPLVTIVGGQIAFQNGQVDPSVRGKALQFQR
jgi:dihydroorotase